MKFALVDAKNNQIRIEDCSDLNGRKTLAFPLPQHPDLSRKSPGHSGGFGPVILEMSPEERHGTAVTYAYRIKNQGKKDYALAYLRWRKEGAVGEEPEAKCSVMAAQAVRMQIDKIMGPIKSEPLPRRNSRPQG
jgi:hypothetical protein